MTLNKIQAELERIGASSATVSLDAEFEPEAGELVKFELEGADWHLLPEHFFELLRDLPDDAGGDAVRTAIERKGPFVWHGPAPEGSRDSSP